jgi:hypothetical protein
VAGDGASTLMGELDDDLHLNGLSMDTILHVYRSGFNRALVSVGLAFGLDPANGMQTWAKGSSLEEPPRKRVPEARQNRPRRDAAARLRWCPSEQDRR